MKRYRVFGGDFDSRAVILTNDIDPAWEPHVKEASRKNQIQVISALMTEFGTLNSEMNIQNFIDLGSTPFSVIAFHNKFLRQIRNAFTIGAYYPALTAASALGERILNHLMRSLKEYYKNTPEYKRIYTKETFDDWRLPIETLDAWNVLLPSVVVNFKSLAEVRNRKAIHFNPDTDQNDRIYALEAIKLLSQIVDQQFSAFGPEPWFIPNTPGCCFIKKEAGKLPFVKVIYIDSGNSLLVGPYHKVEKIVPTSQSFVFHVNDQYAYDDREISDEEFAELYNTHRTSPQTPS